MKKLIFAVIFMTITWSAFAQETILRKNAKGVLESVEFSADDKRVTIPTSAEIFFKDMLKTKATDEFRKVQRKQKQKEFMREYFEQYYKGVKVEGAGYNFHYKNGEMYFAHGHYVDVSNINPRPSITKLEAMQSFAKHKNIPVGDISNYIAELIIKEIFEKTDTLPTLVYRAYLYADYPQNTEIGFIDAHTGKLLMTEPAFIDFSALGTFATRYSGTQQGITHHYQGGYHLVDSTRNAILHTWNLDGRTNILSRVNLIDNDNNWTQVEHRFNNNDMGLDIQWALQGIYDRLFNTHNVNSMDDDGFTIDAHIRYSNNYDNAFWSSVDRILSFGEGGSLFRSLASVDVVAHEFGHGITHFQIGWGSSGDPRAFNEGLSDIWGVIMEHRIRPNSVWQIGEQLTINYACLRNIQNTNASNAMNQIANTYASPQYNSGDSYVRGGVLSHWFYLLVNGGTGTNDLGRSYSVQGVGMDNAESLIIKAVYDGYLRFTTSYAQIRTSMVNAAREIAGTNSFLEHQIENAWYAVGVGDIQYQYPLSGPSTICEQGTFTINNLSQGATVNWTCSSGLSLSVPNGNSTATFQSFPDLITNVYGWVQAEIQMETGGPSLMLRKENITINKPRVHELIVPAIANTGEVLTFTCTMYTPWNVNWIITPNTGFNMNDLGNNSIHIGFSQGGSYKVQVSATSLCGTDIKEKTIRIMGSTPCPGCPPPVLPIMPPTITIYPNPATDLLTIELTEDETENSTLLLPATSTTVEPYTIQLWHERSGLVREIKSTERVTHISLLSLSKGMYFVHIQKESKTIRKQLLWVR